MQKFLVPLFGLRKLRWKFSKVASKEASLKTREKFKGLVYILTKASRWIIFV